MIGRRVEVSEVSTAHYHKRQCTVVLYTNRRILIYRYINLKKKSVCKRFGDRSNVYCSTDMINDLFYSFPCMS